MHRIEDTASTGAISLRDVIARTANAIYAAESTVYLTAGIADTFDNADIFTEATIAKVSFQIPIWPICVYQFFEILRFRRFTHKKDCLKSCRGRAAIWKTMLP